MLLLYASTSGSTRLLAAVICDAIGHDRTEAFELSSSSSLPSLSRRSLILFGTPTYGVGDCHRLWHEHANKLDEPDPSARLVLFALGDARFHGGSFGGGLASLRALLLRVSPRLAATEVTESARLFEFRRDRHAATEQARQWAYSLRLATGKPVGLGLSAGTNK